MKFDFIIKNIVENVSDEIKKEENMNILKINVLNPIIEHVITQLYPYIFKFVLGLIIIFILLLFLIFINLRIIYK